MSSSSLRATSGIGPAARAPRSRRRGPFREQAAKYLFILPAALYIGLFFGYPLVQNITMSLRHYTTSTFFTGQAPWIGLHNYATAVGSNLFGTALLNTLLYTVGSIIGQFVLGLGIALFFSRRFPLNNLIRSFLLLPWLLPSIASSAVWRLMFDQDTGVINVALKSAGLIHDPISWLTSTQLSLLSVIIVNVWAGIPFNVAILYGGLQEIPEDIYEAASLDGAVGWKRFWNITLPNLRPVILVLLVLGAVYTVRTVDTILALTSGGPASSSTTIPVLAYQETFLHYDFGVGAAFSTILIAISLVFAVLYLRASRQAVDE